MCKFFQSIIRSFCLLLLNCYKKGISPFLPHSCRFQPTCSQYMIDAIKEYGTFKGIILGIKRIFRCHPWGGHGFDPVIPKHSSNKSASKKEGLE